jgi:hypothetical protein
VSLEIKVLWDVCLCQLANSYGRLGVPYCLHLRSEEDQDMFFGLLHDHDDDDDDDEDDDDSVIERVDERDI